MKCKGGLTHGRGGLTHGRGVQPSVLVKGTKNMASAAQICESVEEFARFSNDISAEKIHNRQAAITREEADAEKLLDWFTDHYPFNEGSEI